MGARPEEIRSEIEQTRDRITAEIDELTNRYSPGRVAGRKATNARSAALSLCARVTGRKRPQPAPAPYPSDSREHGLETAGRPPARHGEQRTAEQSTAEHRAAVQSAAEQRRADPRAADQRATVASGPAYAAPGSVGAYDADAVFPPTPQRAARTSVPAEQPDARGSTGTQRSAAPGGRHEGRGRGVPTSDLGLMGASLVVGALGARRVLRPGSGAPAASAP